MKQQKLFVIIGPTASGKSEYAVTLAKKYNGEIISADSRQVYRGLDIGTGKVEGVWTPRLSFRPTSRNLKFKPRSRVKHGMTKRRTFIYKSIPHHCIDYVSPKSQYSVAKFQRDAKKAMADILSRGKTPIICGGTGQFVDSLILDTQIPEVPPNTKLRKKLEKKSVGVLFAMLQKKDPVRAKNIDPYNPRRLIRALEIIQATGEPVPKTQNNNVIIKQLNNNPVTIKIHYLNPPRKQLYKKIEKRLKERLNNGMIQEVKKLHAKRITWKRMENLGLEYRYISRYVRGSITYNEMYVQLLGEIKHYAKRQQTWFNKYQRMTSVKGHP